VGTDERALIDIICTRCNDELKCIRSAYTELYQRDLEKDVVSETSGHFRRLLVSCLQCARQEGGAIDMAKATKDANELYQAGEKKWGTDESKFNQILCLRSFPQLRATFEEYRRVAKTDILRTLDREMSGTLRDGFKAVAQSVINRPQYFADRLYAAMHGVGTNDDQLVCIIVARAEVDMVQIKRCFMDTYKKSLSKRIAEDCSGDYKRVLQAIVGDG
jgi:annexin A7/11